MQLTARQRKYLKGLAHPLQPVVYIGQNGVSDSVLNEVNQTLHARELIKIRIRCDDQLEFKNLSDQLADKADANLVQAIGHTVVLYRQSKDPQIGLPVT